MAEQLDMLTSFVVASPARTSAPPDEARDLPALAPGCGSKCDESCPRCGPFGSLLRMSLLFEVAALTRCTPTWSRKATPGGSSWWVLTMSDSPIDESDAGESSSAWPTPAATSYGSSNNGCPGDGREEYATRGKPSLETMARENWPTPTSALASNGARTTEREATNGPNLREVVAKNWPTPRAEDCEQTGAHRGVPDTLTSAARLWPTATAGDSKASGSRTTESSAAHAGISLTDAVVHDLTVADTASRLWCTPTRRDWKDSPGMVQRNTDLHGGPLLPMQVFAELSPDLESPSMDGKPAEPSRMLNADWVLQLMGYPATWARLSTGRGSRPLETASSPTSPRSSGE